MLLCKEDDVGATVEENEAESGLGRVYSTVVVRQVEFSVQRTSIHWRQLIEVASENHVNSAKGLAGVRFCIFETVGNTIKGDTASHGNFIDEKRGDTLGVVDNRIGQCSFLVLVVER
jgi:hypothetical protein